MDIDEIKERGLVVLECISGSRAYGLDTPESDTDIKGVYVLPKDGFYGLNYIPQINNSTNDIVYYELRRFIELLSVNNPNILELLNTPEECVIYRHPIMEDIDMSMFVSKLCCNTFGKFAMSQIKKAQGLKKKIVNPMDRERKSVIDFCYVNYNNGSVPFNKFIEIKGWSAEDCGIANINNMHNTYALFHSNNNLYRGIVQGNSPCDVSLSSIPKGENQVAVLYFNKNGYSTYCKEYREYWDWIEKRNESRYQNNVSHGKNYDSKNMMHTFRLLDMAIEIGDSGIVNVGRPNRDFLLDIKAGKFSYSELIEMADERQIKMEESFKNSSLPDKPDMDKINKLLVKLRDSFYRE
jgi:hypothetical protein